MNIFFRICVAIYSFISMLIFAVIMISPFGEKKLMASLLNFLEINLYSSNSYDILVFVIGLVFFLITLTLLTSGIRGKTSRKYITKVSDENGSVKISSVAIENIALAMSKRFQGVKEVKAKADFSGEKINISMRLTVFTDVNIPELCQSMKERIKTSVENSTNIPVENIAISVEGVWQQSK